MEIVVEGPKIISIGTCTCRQTKPLFGEVCEVRMSKCRGANILLSILRGKLAIYGFDEKILLSTKWDEWNEVLNDISLLLVAATTL